MAKSVKDTVAKSTSVKAKVTTKAPRAKKSPAAKHKIVKQGGGKAHMVILNVVAFKKEIENEDSVAREKLPFLTEINGKSTIANALTKLKSLGWIEFTPTTVSITEEGMKNVDEAELTKARASIPTSNQQHWENVKERFRLKGTKLALFEALEDGRKHPKKELLTEIFGKVNSTSANACTDMKKNGIITFDKDTIKLDDKMFPVEPRPEE